MTSAPNAICVPSWNTPSTTNDASAACWSRTNVCNFPRRGNAATAPNAAAINVEDCKEPYRAQIPNQQMNAWMSRASISAAATT